MRFIILISGLTAIVLLLYKHFPETLNNDNNLISLISIFTLLALILYRIANSGTNLSLILKQIFSWILIIFISLACYSYKFELTQFSNRILANLLPGYGLMNDNQSMVFYAENNGHFTISATLDDKANVNFLLDTGASSVTLTATDALKLGININDLTFNIPFNTANGTSWGASIIIEKIQIGSIIVYKVPASVSQPGNLDSSLLGMTFLNRLSSFQIQNNKLTLNK